MERSCFALWQQLRFCICLKWKPVILYDTFMFRLVLCVSYSLNSTGESKTFRSKSKENQDNIE